MLILYSLRVLAHLRFFINFLHKVLHCLPVRAISFLIWNLVGCLTRFSCRVSYFPFRGDFWVLISSSDSRLFNWKDFFILTPPAACRPELFLSGCSTNTLGLESHNSLISLDLGSEFALLGTCPFCVCFLMKWYTSSVPMLFSHKMRG